MILGCENYDIDELFGFKKIDDGYAVRFLKNDDPEITELEIPAEYNGEPVTRIKAYGFDYSKHLKRVVIPPSVRVIDAAAFSDCFSLETVELSEGLEEIRNIAFANTALNSIVLPKSLTRIFSEAFKLCLRLESVVFNSADSKILLGERVFFGCHKLPADITLMGLVNSLDLSRPLDAYTYDTAFNSTGFNPTSFITSRYNATWREEQVKYFRPDVFELAAKNDCFRSVDVLPVLKALIKNDDAKSLRVAEEYGIINIREIVDRCVEYSAGLGKTEITAYLLELKNRRFGFAGFGGDDDLGE